MQTYRCLDAYHLDDPDFAELTEWEKVRVASLTKLQNNDTPSPMDEPLHTVLAGGTHHALQVAAFMAQHNGGNIARDVDSPISTITQTGSQQQLVTSHLGMTRNNDSGHDMRDPLNTLVGSSHAQLVYAFLQKYNRDAPGQALDGAKCLGLNKDGSPRHPLYVRKDTPLIRFDPEVLRG